MQSLKVYSDNVLEDIESKILEQIFEVYSPSVADLLIGRSDVSNFLVNDKTQA